MASLALAPPGWPKDKPLQFGSIDVEGGQVICSFEAVSLLDPDVINGLQKGMTAALEFQIQLWEKRSGWVDGLVSEKHLRMKINFDKWEKRYVLVGRDGNPRLYSEARMKTSCQRQEDVPICTVSDLNRGSRYVIGVRVTLQPMSMENYQEIRSWLRGEVSEIDAEAITTGKAPGKKAGHWLLGLVLNLTGFGNRSMSARSPEFIWSEGKIITDQTE